VHPHYGYWSGYVHLMSPSNGLSKALLFFKFKCVGQGLIFSLISRCICDALTQLRTDMSTRKICWGEGGRCLGLTTWHIHVPIVLKFGNLNLLEASDPVQGLRYLLRTVVLDMFGRSKEAGRFFAKPGIPKRFFFAGVTEKRGGIRFC
jgi:hypothetical protein